MDQYSQMTLLSKFDLDGFNPDMSFQITLDDLKEKNDDNDNLSLDLISNHIKTSLKKDKDLSESVMDLTKCFICLGMARNPLSCPKCNNFACQDCLDQYFGNQFAKLCPLCKKTIIKSELKKNKTIRDIEKIIGKEDSKKNKINELIKLLNEKKKKWDETQEGYINTLINKVVQYQENLKEYKKNYELFFSTWKEQINRMFEKYEKKIEDLIELLIQYKQKYYNDLSISINNSNKIIEKNKISSKDISSLVNEIISIDRKYFNEETRKQKIDSKEDKISSFSFNDVIKKSKEFFIMPILIIPNISNYNIETLYISKKDILKGKINKKDYNVHVGYYQLIHEFDRNKFTSHIKLYLKNDRDMAIFPVQKKVIDAKFFDIILMKNSSDLTHYIYEAYIDLSELKNDEQKTIKMETKIQIFSVIGL